MNNKKEMKKKKKKCIFWPFGKKHFALGKRNIWPFSGFLVRYLRDAFFAPLGMLLVMKTLEDEL